MRRLLVAAIAAVVIVALVAVQLLVPFSSPPPYGGSGVAYAKNQNGLTLGIAISPVSPAAGQNVVTTVMEINRLDAVNNVTAARSFPTWARFEAGSCSDGVLPYGIAVFQGNRTSNANAAQLEVFPPLLCPMHLRLVTGYLFAPSSSTATVLPGNSTTQLTTTVDMSGYYPQGSQTARPFPPGVYTVVAADEWGDAATLYFVVA